VFPVSKVYHSLCTATLRLRKLPAGLSRKADKILSAYGGLKGLAEQPVWIITVVLKTFFTEDEGRQVLDYVGRLAVGKDRT
jgi:hypothetical protein